MPGHASGVALEKSGAEPWRTEEMNIGLAEEQADFDWPLVRRVETRPFATRPFPGR